MAIEEDIRDLQKIVQGLHERLGHVWYRDNLAKGKRAECARGASKRITEEEYVALPEVYELESLL